MQFASHHKTEDFILDDDFITMVQQQQHDKIIALQEYYPEKKKLIQEAAIFIRYIKIECPDVPEAQITSDWKKLSGILSARKKQRRNNKRLKVWLSGAVAAVLILMAVFTYTYNYRLPVLPDTKEMMASALNAANYNSGEIMVVAGETYYQVDNNATLVHNDNGELILNKKTLHIDSEYIVLAVPRGRRLNIEFADGTVAWMNAESKVIYPKTFSPERRDIFMEGEMYLDVATNKEKPFSVFTRNFDVKVLGTEFNISAYKDDTVNSVVLVEGSVEISANDAVNKLLPNQGFFTESNLSGIKNVDVYPYISWKEGIIKLDGVPLSGILKKISRYYGINIHIDKNFENEIYVGKLNLNEPVETVLYNLSLSTKFKYTRENNDIYIN